MEFKRNVCKIHWVNKFSKSCKEWRSLQFFVSVTHNGRGEFGVTLESMKPNQISVFHSFLYSLGGM